MSERTRSRDRTANLFRKTISQSLKRPEKLSVTEWAQKYRILDDSSAIKGKFNINITPYMKEIMDDFCDPYIQEINLVKGSQLGGTTAMENMIGWIVAQSPAPTMVVYPDDDAAKDTSNNNIRPMVEMTPCLKNRFYPSLSKETELKFRGCKIYFRSARTPMKIAKKAIRYLFFDEIDKMTGATKKEASPYSLARERTKTFKLNKKIYTCSTPTIKTNYVWTIHEAADEQRKFFIPCPHCGEMIELVMKQVIWDRDEEKKLSNAERAKTATYVCQECGCEITDKQKITALQKGEWRAVKKNGTGNPRSVSYHINSLYSFFVSWEDAAREWMDSYNDPEKFQNFVNSWLGEPWEDEKLKTSEDTVMERQTEVPEFVVPKWAHLLTGGVDVQKKSVYWVIRAWGSHMTSQNIAHGQLLSLNDVETVMNMEYRKRNGDQFLVKMALIDSGDQTDTVYDFCTENSDWAVPCKGTDGGDSTYRISTINKNGKAYSIQLVLVDGGAYKNMIAGRMLRKNGEGSWMVHSDCDFEYAKQVTAEHRVLEKSNGKPKLVWKPKHHHADNHYLDAEVYAFAAADICGVRALLEQEEDAVTEVKADERDGEQWIEAQAAWI
ncbi:MAG: phage terminase large subunit family protein [Eubacteriales bacterium]|nr:phage terminase large subunit family protein [Eubacteriales bacterium]